MIRSDIATVFGCTAPTIDAAHWVANHWVLPLSSRLGPRRRIVIHDAPKTGQEKAPPIGEAEITSSETPA
jgi:hypothetical protein